jgi:thioredoxin-like negative regulator of GroEL
MSTASHSAGSYGVNHFDISTIQELSAILKQSKGKIIMRFYRPGCPACDSSTGSWMDMTLRPENRTSCTFVSVNVLDNRPLSIAMKIESIPTFVCVQKGRKAIVLVGADMDRLAQVISS